MSKSSISDYYREALENIREEVLSKSDEYILGVKVDEYSDYLYSKYELPKIEKDPSREIIVEQEKTFEEIDAFKRKVRTETVMAKISYPILSPRLVAEVLERSASSWFAGIPKFEYHMGGWIVLKTYPAPDEIETAINNLSQIISLKNADVEKGNAELRRTIPGIIKERVEKVRSDKEAFERAVQQVKIPLKMKPADQVPVIDLQIRKELKPLMPPKAERPKEFVLDKTHVLTIIGMIDKIGRQFEVTPKVYSNLEEENLRDIILSNLNTVFEGSATGETFSKLGKTDIHLNITQGNILVAECKYWEGEKAYHEAIDQLFRYLTWRQNYGILIAFSRRQRFTQVLETAKKGIKAHKTYKSGFAELKMTHFESRHTFPDDNNKVIEIHHLFYNLYVLQQ